MRLLYVDGSPRGDDVSRTLRLAHAFLDAFLIARPDAEIISCRLPQMHLAPVGGEVLALREALIDERRWDHPIFALARDFAAADAVVIAAPYWDLMFPAAVKVYIEHVFIREMTFCYRDDEPIGLCRARRAAFLTTAGSPIGENDFGTDYLRAAFAMLGIGRLDAVKAEGIDIRGAAVEQILQEAQTRAAALGRAFAMEQGGTKC